MVVSIASKRIVTVEIAKPASTAMNVHCECMDSRIRMLPVGTERDLVGADIRRFGRARNPKSFVRIKTSESNLLAIYTRSDDCYMFLLDSIRLRSRIIDD